MIVLFFVLLHINTTSFPQQDSVELKRQSTSYRIAGEEIVLQEYRVINNSCQCYFTWLDVKQGKYYSNDSSVRLKSYLFAPRGDFSFASLMFDNVVFDGEFKPELGFSFMKRIKPGESFSYILYYSTRDSLYSKTSFDSLINIESESLINSLLPNGFPEEFLYRNNSIIINPKHVNRIISNQK